MTATLSKKNYKRRRTRSMRMQKKKNEKQKPVSEQRKD